MIRVSFRCDEYFIMSMSVVASNVCFPLAVSWIFYIMGHQQCLLIYQRARSLFFCSAKYQEVRPPNLGVPPPAKLVVAPRPRVGMAPPARDWLWLKQSSSEPPRPHTCCGAFSR